MILKRPSFRRGGNAGIGSITPRVNARFGFGFLRKGMGGDKLFPQKIGTTPSAGGTGVEGIIGQGMMETLISGGSRFKPPVVAAPLYGKIAAVTAPIAAVGGLAYLNRPDNTFSEYADMWYNIPYPNLKGTERDIQYIQDTQDAYMQKPNWKKYKKFMMLCDSDIKKVIFKICSKRP